MDEGGGGRGRRDGRGGLQYQAQEEFTPSYSNFFTPNKTRRDATSISAQRKGGADLIYMCISGTSARR